MRETDLARFRIPEIVERIDGSAFGGSTTMAITVDDANLHFRVDGDFLVDAHGRTLIRYFGRAAHVAIDENIEVLAPGCCYAHPLLLQCEFPEGSRLRAVAERAFCGCCLGDVALPQGVRHIGRKAFPSSARVSIINLPVADQAQFNDWESRRTFEFSLVLDLPRESG
jgi:hypothetical protein